MGSYHLPSSTSHGWPLRQSTGTFLVASAWENSCSESHPPPSLVQGSRPQNRLSTMDRLCIAGGGGGGGE
ncbi:hypothetical protein OIU78_027358 [Salix suchowensis]|nr:hypothetical protein OIU78_027358 [Salix suchowensis]